MLCIEGKIGLVSVSSVLSVPHPPQDLSDETQGVEGRLGGTPSQQWLMGM